VGGTQIRPAEPRDAAAIARVHVCAWQGAYRGLVPDALLDGLSVAQREEVWRGILAGEGAASSTLVARRNGSLVAFCSLAAPSRDDDAAPATCEIAAIYVEPASWRQGIGRALLAAAVRRALDDGFDDATLWAFAQNRAGRAFYERIGFEPDGAQRWHEPSGQQVIRWRAACTAVLEAAGLPPSR
jgi:GNAT superfamily N-acetyltransferase